MNQTSKEVLITQQTMDGTPASNENAGDATDDAATAGANLVNSRMKGYSIAYMYPNLRKKAVNLTLQTSSCDIGNHRK